MNEVLIGKDPFIQVFCEAMQKLPRSDCRLPISDDSVKDAYLKSSESADQILDLVTNRKSLRDFCLQKGIPAPAARTAATFDELAQTVIKMKKFPLAIKSVNNSSWGMTVFRLEGFRELEKFFEKIKARNPADVLVEEWVASEALIEITVGFKGFRLVTQVVLDKALIARPAWRQFPVAIPAKFEHEIENLLSPFEKMAEGKFLLRFTIALMRKGISLLALNAGYNRLEYFPGWVEPFGMSPAVLLPSNSTLPQTSKKFKYGRIQFFYRSKKDPNFPLTLPQTTSGLPILNFFPGERVAAILLGSDEPRRFAEYSRILKAIMSEYSPQENGKTDLSAR